MLYLCNNIKRPFSHRQLRLLSLPFKEDLITLEEPDPISTNLSHSEACLSAHVSPEQEQTGYLADEGKLCPAPTIRKHDFSLMHTYYMGMASS